MTLCLVCSLCTLAGCDVKKMSTLPELSRPYAGVYTCEDVRIGGEAAPCRLTLELEYGGSFTLSYEEKDGVKGEWSGSYTVDETKDVITMSVVEGSERRFYSYRMEKGAVYLSENALGRPVLAVLKMH